MSREAYSDRHCFVADKGQSLLRVDKFLVDRMMGATRNRIQLAAEAGCILVNDKPVKSNYRVKPLDVVSIVMDVRYEAEMLIHLARRCFVFFRHQQVVYLFIIHIVLPAPGG